MKTKSLLFTALVMISAVVSAVGKDEPRRTGMAVVPVKGSGIYKVIYKGETAGKVRLNIYNASAQLILTETFNGVDGFICPLNFAGLQAGDYTIEIVDGTGKKIEKISYLAKKNAKFIHVSKISNEAGKFLLSVVNGAANEEISVKIYDDKNNLIHTESKELKGDFAQVYKVGNLSTSYTFEISDKSGNVKTYNF
jgi:hypothetical protein